MRLNRSSRSTNASPIGAWSKMTASRPKASASSRSAVWAWVSTRRSRRAARCVRSRSQAAHTAIRATTTTVDRRMTAWASVSPLQSVLTSPSTIASAATTAVAPVLVASAASNGGIAYRPTSAVDSPVRRSSVNLTSSSASAAASTTVERDGRTVRAYHAGGSGGAHRRRLTRSATSVDQPKPVAPMPAPVRGW